MPNENLILTLGRPQGVETMVELPGFKVAARIPNNRRRRGDRHGADRRPKAARFRAAGTAMTPRRRSCSIPTTAQAMSALDALRGRSLVDWVERGGHLVVAVGANWQIVRDSVLAPILPGLPNGQERVTSLEALDSFAGSTKQITPPGTPAGDGDEARGSQGARRHGPGA